MIKKLFLALVITLTSFVVYAADVETGQVAELYEHPKGRSVYSDQSELITIWYDSASSGLTGAFGVSGTSATEDLQLVFYESGQEITATRFSDYAPISLYDSGSTTEDTVEQIVNLINSDSSNYFKAAQGRDATPGTAVIRILAVDYNELSTSEDNAIDNGDVLKEDTSASLMLRAGFKPNSRKTYRLKRLEETVEGTGTHNIKVWNDKEIVYRRTYDSEQIYSGTSNWGAADNGVTPLTITFTDYGAKGLSATKAKNLTVTSEWSSTLAGTSETNANLSIVVGEWTE